MKSYLVNQFISQLIQLPLNHLNLYLHHLKKELNAQIVIALFHLLLIKYFSFLFFLSNSFIKFIVNVTSFHAPSATNQFKSNIFHNINIVLNVVLLLHKLIYHIILIISILLNLVFVVK